MTRYYRLDNTTGYTQAQLDALNAELQDLLADLASSTDDNATPEEVAALISRHAHDVARR